MKRSLYDIFDHYNDDLQKLPSLKGQPMHEKTVTELVMQKTGCHLEQKQRKSHRIFAVFAAAATLACGTITVGAVSGKMGLFFDVISGSKFSDIAEEVTVPGVGMEISEAAAQMQSYYDCPDVVFTQTDAATVELLGIYNDHNTLMISMQLTIQDGTQLTDDMYMLPYFTLTTADGTVKELSQGGYLSEPFQKCETAENIYYLTYYLLDSDFSGGILQIDLSGIYTSSQEASVHESIVALQDTWHEQYFSESMSVEEWKKFWKDQNFDGQTMQAQKEAFADMDAVLPGTWSAEVPIPESNTTPITAEADGLQVIIDDLSVYVSTPSEEQRKMGSYTPIVYLKDGTVMIEDDLVLDCFETNLETDYQRFAYTRGVVSEDWMTSQDAIKGCIYCYQRPIVPEEVEKVELLIRYYDADWNQMQDTYLLYQAE